MANSISTRVLLALLAADLGFVLLHLASGTLAPGNDLLRLDRERSLAEMFQYAKALSCAAMLVLMARRENAALLWIASALAVFLFVEDAVGLHEFLGGEVLGGRLFSDAGRDAYHIGQFWYGLVVSAGIAAVLLVGWRSASPGTRRIAIGFIVFVGMLGFAAIFVDRIPTDLVDAEWWPTAIGVVEEGGEHLAMTGAVWWLVRCIRETPTFDARCKYQS